MLEQIIGTIDSPKDYLNFIPVCKTWHSVARAREYSPGCNLPLFHPLPKKYPLPTLLHPHGQDSEVHYFYSFTKRKIINKLQVPELSNKWISESWRGWLATIDINGDNLIHLLNPVTKVQILLPPLSTFPKPIHSDIRRSSHVDKIVVVSSGEVDVQSNCTIVALEGSLHFCRFGDDKWKIIYPSICNIKDVIEFK